MTPLRGGKEWLTFDLQNKFVSGTTNVAVDKQK